MPGTGYVLWNALWHPITPTRIPKVIDKRHSLIRFIVRFTVMSSLNVLFQYASVLRKIKLIVHNEIPIDLAGKFLLVQRIQRTYLYSRSDIARPIPWHLDSR